VPIRARFSLGGGNPTAPDNAQDNVPGLAVKFDLGNGASTDIVTIYAPVFFVKTPEFASMKARFPSINRELTCAA
jgi:catalase